MFSIDQYDLKLTSLGANPQQRVFLPRGGTFIRCTAAGADFDLSIDGAPPVRFGVGRSIEPRNADGSVRPFQNFEVIRVQDGTVNVDEFTLTVVVGNVAMSDNRFALFPNQTIRTTNAAKMLSVDITLTGANDSLSSIAGLGNGAFLTNLRNMGANPMRFICSDVAAEYNTLSPSRGFYLAPGENVDLPISMQFLFARGTAGDKVSVTCFYY